MTRVRCALLPNVLSLLGLLACQDEADRSLEFSTEPIACSEERSESQCCTTQVERPTTAASILDLSDTIPGSPGTCSDYFLRDSAVELPADPEAYPLKIILPAVTEPDAECAARCGLHSELGATTFGIAISARGLANAKPEDLLITAYVPPPWRFVSGGCGESCAWPCLGGYQEFGARTCISETYGDLGFATADRNAPAVEVLIELRADGDYGPQNCCPYE